MSRFEGKLAIVTGASGGLGGAAARLLAAGGATVLLTDVAENAGQRLAEEIGGRFLHHDVADEARWADVVREALRLGAIDILVNAAGIEGDLGQGGLATSHAEFRRVLSINLDGTFLGCMAVMPHMMDRRTGAIVNIASIVSFMGTPSGLAYGVSKAGVEQMTRSLAIIGAEDGRRVRCNSVHPGFIRTRMTDDIVETFARANGMTAPEAEAAVNSAIPFRERGTPDDIANMIGFLASDEAAYITGSAFRVDGGWSVISAG